MFVIFFDISNDPSLDVHCLVKGRGGAGRGQGKTCGTRLLLQFDVKRAGEGVVWMNVVLWISSRSWVKNLFPWPTRPWRLFYIILSFSSQSSIPVRYSPSVSRSPSLVPYPHMVSKSSVRTLSVLDPYPGPVSLFLLFTSCPFS